MTFTPISEWYNSIIYQHENYNRDDMLLGFDCEYLEPRRFNLPTRLKIIQGYCPPNGEDLTTQTPFILVYGIHGSCEAEGNFCDSKLVPVTLSLSPEIMISDEMLNERSNMSSENWSEIYEFIKRNHDVLKLFWDGKFEETYDNPDDMNFYPYLENFLSIKTATGDLTNVPSP